MLFRWVAISMGIWDPEMFSLRKFSYRKKEIEKIWNTCRSGLTCRQCGMKSTSASHHAETDSLSENIFVPFLEGESKKWKQMTWNWFRSVADEKWAHFWQLVLQNLTRCGCDKHVSATRRWKSAVKNWILCSYLYLETFCWHVLVSICFLIYMTVLLVAMHTSLFSQFYRIPFNIANLERLIHLRLKFLIKVCHSRNSSS